MYCLDLVLVKKFQSTKYSLKFYITLKHAFSLEVKCLEESISSQALKEEWSGE